MEMNDISNFILILFKITIFFHQISFTLSFNVNNACALFKENVLIGSPEDCAIYYKCTNNGAIELKCDNGFYFSKNLQNCLPKNQVKCIGNKDDPCSGQPIGSFIEDPDTCSGYYYCDLNRGALKNYCPNGLIFQSSTSSCEYDTIPKCENSGGKKIKNICSYFPNNLHFGSTKYCNIWQICINDILKSGKCPNDQFYRPSTSSCDYSFNVNCKHVTKDNSIPTNPVEEKCSINEEFKKISIDESCSTYGICINGKYELKKCSTNEFFDIIDEKCKNRLNAKTNKACDRCEDSKLSFVIAGTDECRTYLACNNGVKQYEGKCPLNMFFNEIKGGCVYNNPKFPACSTESITISTIKITESIGTSEIPTTVTTSPTLTSTTLITTETSETSTTVNVSPALKSSILIKSVFPEISQE